MMKVYNNYLVSHMFYTKRTSGVSSLLISSPFSGYSRWTIFTCQLKFMIHKLNLSKKISLKIVANRRTHKRHMRSYKMNSKIIRRERSNSINFYLIKKTVSHLKTLRRNSIWSFPIWYLRYVYYREFWLIRVRLFIAPNLCKPSWKSEVRSKLSLFMFLRIYSIAFWLIYNVLQNRKPRIWASSLNNCYCLSQTGMTSISTETIWKPIME